jgi:hypothetical protein
MPAVPCPGAALIFLRELSSSGSPVIRLHGYGPSPEGLQLLEEDAGQDLLLIPLLKSWHLEAVEDIGGPPLPFDGSAARHGALLLLRAAWFYLHRDSDTTAVTRALSEPPPGPPNPAALFSADLTLQRLPSLFRMAQALAPGDPLLAALRKLGHSWPLSGIHIPPAPTDEPSPPFPSADPAAWTALRQHQGLWQLFLDRLLDRPASPWKHHPEVAASLQQSLGAYARELAPRLEIMPGC